MASQVLVGSLGSVIGVKGARCGVAAAIVLLLGGCAFSPMQSSGNISAPTTVERDTLVHAAKAVEQVPWPKPEQVSLVSRMTGGGGDRVTRSDAIAAYVAELMPSGERFEDLVEDAMANLDAATRLDIAAQNAASAPRLAASDVSVLEGAIQTLRENRQIYVSAAKDLTKLGEPVDDNDIDTIRDAYGEAIKSLGETADLLAERLEDNRAQSYAGPDKTIRHKLSGT